jgi:hypothetical protein
LHAFSVAATTMATTQEPARTDMTSRYASRG